MTTSTAHRRNTPAVTALALAYWRLHIRTVAENATVRNPNLEAFLSELEMARILGAADSGVDQVVDYSTGASTGGGKNESTLRRRSVNGNGISAETTSTGGGATSKKSLEVQDYENPEKRGAK